MATATNQHGLIMFRSWIKPLIAGAFFLLATLAHADQYPDSAGSTQVRVTVTVVWLKDFEAVDTVCSALGWAKPGNDIVGCYHPATQTIYAVQPTNFNDYLHLTILGHEFWHALGAEHP